MPTSNAAGDIIYEVELTHREKVRNARLSSYVYPKDKEKIFHLSPGDFRIWLYLLDPKEALHLCSTHVINTLVKEQLHPTFWKQASDFFWRVAH